MGSGTSHHPQPAGPQGPGAGRAAGSVYRVGMDTEPREGSGGPEGALERSGGWARAAERSPAAPFLGKSIVLLVSSLGNWKPWTPPRAIIRPCPLTKLKIKGPHPRALWAGRG